ncbi:MAG: LLM class F420-dependent oxidoreductase [Acidimicrobiaceae bacterium]|nr:LLM class F420-dependent oxidoreductase [Acidimicrobiaceae bacterium]
MDFRIFIEPQQGASYEQQLRVAKSAEQLGFGAFFRSDHYLRMGSGSPLPGPTDSWVTLAGIARETSTIRLGTLLTSATFRLPGILAISVAQVDQMSGGRVELGLGAGWFEEEHAAWGIPFPSTSERFERLEEQLQIIRGIWSTQEGSNFNYSGSHFTLADCTALPKPAQAPRPPIVVGGLGPAKTPALAAKYADEYNAPFASVDLCRTQFAAVRSAAEKAGRDPEEIVTSVALVACMSNDPKVLRERASSIGRELTELEESGLSGTSEQILEKIEMYQAVGVTRIYLQILDLNDLAHLEELADSLL